MSDTEQTWIVTSYLLTLASLMAIGGRIGDLVGKVPAFVAGVVGFALASVVCANAHDGTQMIVGRVLQGLSACLMQPASSALVIGAFAPGERGKAMAVYVGIPLMFMALGPALGGVVVQRMGWPWVFWLNLPIAGAALVLTLIARPRDARSADRSIDWLGGAMLLLGLPPFVFGVDRLGSEPAWPPWPIRSRSGCLRGARWSSRSSLVGSGGIRAPFFACTSLRIMRSLPPPSPSAACSSR
jgi:MFS family permease